MNGMFRGASSFNGNISTWDVSGVVDMTDMFSGALTFDGNLSTWDVLNVESMNGMFWHAFAFDGNLSTWDVSSVTDMDSMFNGAINFNQDLSAWDVSSVTDMNGMFAGASAFRQNLGNWYVALDSTVIHADDAPGIVGAISAQNQALDNQNPTYGIGAGGDAGSFEITGGSSLSMTVSPTKSLYTVNITSTGSFGTSNHRVYNVTVTNLNTAFSQSSDGSFVTTWKTTSAGETVTIPVGNAAGNYTVHWGDGNVTTHTSDATHTYAAAGNHTVRISGDFTRIYLTGDSDNASKLVSIDQWGDVRWESMNGAFRGALNMIYNATDVPDLSGVWDASSMFRNAASFDGDLSAWDVSGVTNMAGMFVGASAFDGDLSAWDVSGVTNMHSMFRGAASFDGDLSAWDVSGVTYMYNMFRGAASFDGDLSEWDVSSITIMDSMFTDASAFRQNLGNWYVALDSTVIHADDAPGIVGAISAQNQALGDQNPTYGIGAGGDAGSFEITGGSSLNMTVSPTKSLYTVNITSTGSFGTSNHRVYNVTATNLNTAFSQSSDGSFVTTWKTTSAGETVTIPVGNAAGNYTVHWGDGNVTTHTSDATHTYAAAGNHTVRISGDFTRIYLTGDSDNAAKLVSIDQWGDVRWESMNGAFRGALNMIYNATDVPDLSGVWDASSMFRNAASFDGDLSAWDVSGVTNVHSMFRGAASFDGDLSEWDVSSITIMDSMFTGASAFRQNLGNWYVALDSTVIHADDAPGIVGTISAQNQYLDNQNPAYGIGAGGDAGSFEITGGSSLNMTVSPTKSLYTVNITSTGSFGTSNHRVYNVTVTNLNTTFSQSSDGSFVTTWKTTSAGETITIPVGNAGGSYTVRWGDGSVTTHTSDAIHTYAAAGDHTVRMSGDFTRINLPNAPTNTKRLVSIDQWGDVRWESMNGAFYGASNMIYSATDAPDLSRVTDMSFMFAGASAFDGNLSDWDVSRVTDMTGMFNRAPSFDGNLSAWDVSSVTDMTSMFGSASKFNGNLSAWDVSSVTHMNRMFGGAYNFDGNLSAWDVSNVESMNGMFGGASKFNGNLSAWDVSSVESMNGMFGSAYKFNGNLSAWDVSSVESMNDMFRGASSFNGNISTWDVSGVVGMTGMFFGASAFDGNLSAWDVSSATDIGGMFLDAAAFNGDLSSWDVSNVESMNGMFWRAFAFDGNLSSWDVSNVEYMRGMFFGASAFDGDLSDWDVSSVIDMDGMFNGAINFNQDLSAWDVSSVIYMDDMFTGASAFRQNLGNWYVVLDDTVIFNATETLAIRAQKLVA